MTSCTSFKEAYNDRVCFNANSTVPLQCKEVFIDFKCNETIKMPVNELIKPAKIIVTRRTRDYASPKVGELFSQHGNIPIFVKNGSPWMTLNNDIDQILMQAGYKVVHGSEKMENVLDMNIKFLDVRSDDPGWTSLKGATRATASFKITLKKNKVIVWSEEFSSTDHEEVYYALLSDSEKLLNSAYCKSLRKFADAILMQEFSERVE